VTRGHLVLLAAWGNSLFVKRRKSCGGFCEKGVENTSRPVFEEMRRKEKGGTRLSKEVFMLRRGSRRTINA